MIGSGGKWARRVVGCEEGREKRGQVLRRHLLWSNVLPVFTRLHVFPFFI